MDAVRDRLRERALDVMDWVDYRPDPHWWQYLAVPVVLAGAYFFTPMGLGPILVMITLAVTTLALVAWGLGVVTVIAWRAIRDIIEQMLRRRRGPAYGHQILIGRFN